MLRRPNKENKQHPCLFGALNLKPTDSPSSSVPLAMRATKYGEPEWQLTGAPPRLEVQRPREVFLQNKHLLAEAGVWGQAVIGKEHGFEVGSL